MPDVFFISPHLDDAILSCGLQILRHVAGGHDVTVISVFTEGDGDEHARRRAEDSAACAVLGARHMHLGFRDAPFRNSRYMNIARMVFGEMDDDDRACIRDIARRTGEIVSARRPAAVYVPLAAGGHIDHRMVWEGCSDLPAITRTFYYEDRPYVTWEGILDTRLNEIGVIRYGTQADAKTMESSIDNHFFLRAFVPAGPVRAECLPLYLRRLEESRINFKPRRNATAIDLPATGGEADQIWRALQCYGSQIGLIHQDIHDFAGAHGYRERYWDIGNDITGGQG